MLDQAAVLAVFPTFRSAHLHMEGMIVTLHQQITQTAENLAQASQSPSIGGERRQVFSARLVARCQLRDRAVELRSLIEVCDRLDEVSPATVPVARLSHQRLYAEAERITLGKAEPAAPSGRSELSQHHGTGQEIVHPQGQRVTGRQR